MYMRTEVRLGYATRKKYEQMRIFPKFGSPVDSTISQTLIEFLKRNKIALSINLDKILKALKILYKNT